MDIVKLPTRETFTDMETSPYAGRLRPLSREHVECVVVTILVINCIMLCEVQILLTKRYHKIPPLISLNRYKQYRNMNIIVIM